MAPIVFNISFSYPDQVKAQAAVRDLAGRFTTDNVTLNRVRDEVHQGFWQDMSMGVHTKPAPPPPVGEIVGVLDTVADGIGRSKSPGFSGVGTWCGAGFGLLAGLAMRRPRGVRQLGEFALAGFAVVCGLSYLIPNRFTSSAVMTVAPAILTEDPQTPLSAAIPSSSVKWSRTF
jgi:hypothetical protein